ncbi:MAG: hypothetical protein Kow0070_28650 [Anaerolineales bacterium]
MQEAQHRAMDAKIERMEETERAAWEAWKNRSQTLAAQRAEERRQQAANAWAAYRAGERANYEPATQPKSLWQRAGEWITTTVWEKVKEWWRVHTLKLDHPPYPLPDAGSGTHGSRRPTWADFAFEKVLQAGAVKFQLQGYDDAARHMSHYLGDSGRELKVNVDEMMTEIPQFKSAVQATLESTLKKNLSAIPLSQGVESRFETDWIDFYAKQQNSPNWFYAMGGYYYWIGANAKVISAPRENNAIIKVVYRIAVSDYYNWDAGKATTFPKPEGIKIPSLPETYEGKIIDLGDTLLIYDTALAELHKAGIAQEYHIAGETAKKVIYYEYNTATSELIPVNP